MKIPKITLIGLLTLFCLVPTTWAEADSTDSAPTIVVDPLCIESKEVCYERAVKQYERAARQKAIRQRCIDDPTWCEQQRKIRKEKHELRKQCKAHPDKCDELTRQFNKRRAKERQKAQKEIKQAQEQWCNDNSTACEQWKAELKELQKKCRDLRLEIFDKYGVPRKDELSP